MEKGGGGGGGMEFNISLLCALLAWGDDVIIFLYCTRNMDDVIIMEKPNWYRTYYIG